MKQIGVHLPFTKTMKILIGVTVAIWIIGQIFLERYADFPITKYFALYPGKVIYDGAIWQLVSYMFLHTRELSHILLNMLMLWFMGAELEGRWGSRYFLFYYFATGIGAAVLYVLGVFAYSMATGSTTTLVIPVMGASGAIFGLMMAYGILFGDRTIHFMMLFPMKARFFVMILGAVEVMSILTNGVAGGEVANLAHLGGLISGYLTLLGTTRWKQRDWGRKNKKKGPNLRLVVSNEKKKESGEDPRYWN